MAINRTSGCEFRLHDLRRTFASVVNHQLSAQFSHYTIKKLLNHRTSDVTTGYIQLTPEDLRRPMKMVEIFMLAQRACIPSDGEIITGRSPQTATDFGK